MERTLLLAKLRRPLLRPSFVARQRLLARLDAELTKEETWQHKLTLVSAPAGYGKTTLLCQWLSGADYPVAWVSLDENDNDPTRFLTYLVAAFQQAAPELETGLLDSLQAASVPSPGSPPAADVTLATLLNELEALRAPLLLVLDDYHVIGNRAVHEAVSFLLDKQPPSLHLVVASRSDPPLPVARLRAQGQLAEVHARDLSFAPAEAADFLNEAMGLDLTAEQVAALVRRTEGWIAGLQLAGLALQGARRGRETGQVPRVKAGAPSVSAFIEAFTGSHRFVLDYLTEEALNQQSAEIRAFLLRSSVLDRLSAPLCNALTNRNDSQQILEMLTAANLFIVPLDDNRCWYRYHHLFADLLRQRLQRERPGLAHELHGRASAWYEAEGWLVEAIHHALLADHPVRAASLIEDNGWAVLMRGEMNTLLRWLEALPEEIVSARPALGILRAWAFAFGGEWVALERALPAAAGGELSGEVAAVGAYAAAVQGDVVKTRELAEHALRQLSEGQPFLRSLVTFCLAVTYFSSGRPKPAKGALVEVLRLGREAGQHHLVMTATAHLGHVYEMEGQLHRALETHREAVRLASASGSRPVPFQGIASVGMAEVLYEWNDLDGAQNYAQEGIRLTERGGFTSYMLAGYARLVQVCQARGDASGAAEILEKGERLARQHKFRYMQGVFAGLRVRQWLAQGDVAAAKRWAQRQQAGQDDVNGLAREAEQMAVARALMAPARSAVRAEEEALALLAGLLAAAEEAGRTASVVRILALYAVACQQQANTEQALALLTRALALAEPEGYVRTFVDEGQPMVRLLRQAVAGGHAAGYAATLLAAFAEEVVAATTATALVEPLSERELEVLRLIVAGLSNREIAEELVIALSTVKSHINNIYGKLDVKRRAQAIVKAQELGLV